MIIAVVVGAVDVAGGAPLGADHVVAQGVGGDLGAFLDDDDLNGGGVGVGEVHDQQTVIGDGNTGHDDVGLVLLNGQQGGVKVHVQDLQLQAQLFGDGTGDLHVDTGEAAVIGGHLVGREGGVGGHQQLAGLQSHGSGGGLRSGGGLNGGFRGGGGLGGSGGGFGRTGAGAAGEHAGDHQRGKSDSK